MRLFYSSLGNQVAQPELPPIGTDIVAPTSLNIELFNKLNNNLPADTIIPNFVLPANSVRVLLMTGQSNAGAQGGMTGSLPEELKPYNYLTRFVLPATDFVPYDATGITSVGFEFGLAVAYEALANETMYYSRYNIGGSYLEVSLPFNAAYNSFYVTVKKSINKLLASGKRVFVELMMIQGESDSQEPQFSEYPARLQTFINEWRNQLGNNLPIYFVEIHNTGTKSVNTHFHTAAANDSRIKVIPATDLSAVPDNVHYDAGGFKIMAQRYLSIRTALQPAEIINQLEY